MAYAHALAKPQENLLRGELRSMFSRTLATCGAMFEHALHRRTSAGHALHLHLLRDDALFCCARMSYAPCR